MSKEQSYQNAASELLRLVGGKENVISALTVQPDYVWY